MTSSTAGPTPTEFTHQIGDIVSHSRLNSSNCSAFIESLNADNEKGIEFSFCGERPVPANGRLVKLLPDAPDAVAGVPSAVLSFLDAKNVLMEPWRFSPVFALSLAAFPLLLPLSEPWLETTAVPALLALPRLGMIMSSRKTIGSELALMLQEVLQLSERESHAQELRSL